MKNTKSEIAKASWEDPEGRKRHIAGLTRAWANPETRERIIRGIKDSWTDPKKRVRHIRAIQRSQKRPEVQTAKSESMKRTLADPEIRKRMSKLRKDQWTDPKKVALMVETLKVTLSDPKVKKRKSNATKKMWDGLDPVRRKARVEKMQAKIREVWATSRLATVIPIDGAPARPAKQKDGRGRRPDPATLKRVELMAELSLQGLSLSAMSVRIYPERKHSPDAAYANTRRLRLDYKAEFEAAKLRRRAARTVS